MSNHTELLDELNKLKNPNRDHNYTGWENYYNCELIQWYRSQLQQGLYQTNQQQDLHLIDTVSWESYLTDKWRIVNDQAQFMSINSRDGVQDMYWQPSVLLWQHRPIHGYDDPSVEQISEYFRDCGMSTKKPWSMLYLAGAVTLVWQMQQHNSRELTAQFNTALNSFCTAPTEW